MSEIEIESTSVEEAIAEGLRKLGCTRDKVEIKILNEGASGLFGLMGNKAAKVQITTKDHLPADLVKSQARVKEIISEMLKLMKVSFSEINTSLMAGRVLVDIKSDEGKLIIGKNGQTLEALDSIVNLILNRDEDTRVKASLDVEGFRAHQEENLQVLAQKAAEQVKSTGKPFRFEPMPARDRRVIHMALKSDPLLETFSDGEGMFRKVAVKLK